MEIDGRRLAILAAITLVQAVLFYDETAVSLTFLFGIGIGIWLRSWSAVGWALGSFLIAFALAAVTGWLEPLRIWELIFGAGLALLGALIGAGIFLLVPRGAGAEAGERVARTG